MINLKSKLNTVGIFVGGAIGSHLISKTLDYKNVQEGKKEVQEMNSLLQERVANVSKTLDELKDLQCESNEKVNSLLDKWGESAHKVYEIKQTPVKDVKDDNIELYKKMYDACTKCKEDGENFQKALKEFMDSWDNNKSLVSNFNLDSLYDYLNSISLLQEYAIYHILALLLIGSFLLNVIFAILGNEIIEYFQLENKYPKLHGFLKIRMKFQKYYLVLSFSLIFVIILFSILINLIVLY